MGKPNSYFLSLQRVIRTVFMCRNAHSGNVCVLLQMSPPSPLLVMLLSLTLKTVMMHPMPGSHQYPWGTPQLQYGAPQLQYGAPFALGPWQSAIQDDVYDTTAPPTSPAVPEAVVTPNCAAGFIPCGQRCCRSVSQQINCPPLTQNIGGRCVPF